MHHHHHACHRLSFFTRVMWVFGSEAHVCLLLQVEARLHGMSNGVRRNISSIKHQVSQCAIRCHTISTMSAGGVAIVDSSGVAFSHYH